MADDKAFDWTQFHLGVYIRTRPEDVFRHWTTAHGLCRWFLRSAAFAPLVHPAEPAGKRAKTPLPAFDTLVPRADDESCQAGDRYRWEWYYNDGATGEDSIIDVRPPTKLVFGFGDKMTVEVTIRKQGTWSEVNLRQYDIPRTPAARWQIHMGCRTAWVFFLTNLKSVMEKGPDLREVERVRTKQMHLVNI